MMYTIKSFQPTPNPNALKCILDRPITRTPVSFRSAADLPANRPSAAPSSSEPAEGTDSSEAYRLAPSLFAVPGVAGLLFSGDWLTVNKTPQSDWSAVRAGVARVLKGGA